jgi:hypothetical protein
MFLKRKFHFIKPGRPNRAAFIKILTAPSEATIFHLPILPHGHRSSGRNRIDYRIDE